MNDQRSTGAIARLVGGACAWVMLATLPTVASAAIIQGYTDLYVTEGGLGYYPTGGATLCHDNGQVCAKARFNFKYDTTKPPEQLLANLVLLKGYNLLDEPGGYHGLVTTIDGVDYLYYGPFGQRVGAGFFFDQLNRTGEPLLGGLEESDLEDYTSSATFNGTASAVDLAYTGFSLFRGSDCVHCDGPENQNNTHQFSISTAQGGFFYSALLYSDDVSNYDQTRLSYYFNNRPENWIDGPPEARVWVEAPEPASLSLLGVGLLALFITKRKMP